jgi:hypothetical protein
VFKILNAPFKPNGTPRTRSISVHLSVLKCVQVLNTELFSVPEVNSELYTAIRGSKNLESCPSTIDDNFV